VKFKIIYNVLYQNEPQQWWDFYPEKIGFFCSVKAAEKFMSKEKYRNETLKEVTAESMKEGHGIIFRVENYKISF
jgi:hypothetical protein